MSSVLLPAKWICHLARQHDRTQRNPLENTFPNHSKFLLLWFFFNCLFVLCCFYLCYVPLSYYFQRHSQRKRSKKRVWCSSNFIIRTNFMHSGFYNPETVSYILTGDVSPNVRPVSGIWMHIFTVLNVEHVLFDCN